MEEKRSSATPDSTPGAEDIAPPPQEADIIIDGSLLREVARRRLRTWLIVGPIIFIVVVGYQLLKMPQSYTALVTLSVQQSSGGGGSAALVLLGGNSNSKKYIGLLHSRRLAELVESKFHLKQFYKLATERRAIELLMDNVKPEDNAAEGLLYVRVTMTGPARFAPDPNHRRDLARQLAADIANEYVAQLRNYYASSDNDRDSVLLNAANQELLRARADYDRSSANIRAFITDLRHTDSLTAPSSGAEAMSGGGGGTLQGLYDQMIRIEAQIRGAEAAQQSETASKERQLGALASLPSDDPFLGLARQSLADARVNLKTLRDAYQLNEDNPRVIAAREKVRIAAEELKNQEKGYRGGLTTDRLTADSRLKSLQAQRDSILASVREAEAKLPIKRERTTALLELQKEQEIQLTILKATEQKAAELRMTAVSGQSRINVIDSAIPPEIGQPGWMRAALVGGLLAGLLFFPTVLWDYRRQAARGGVRVRHLAPAPHTNGAG